MIILTCIRLLHQSQLQPKDKVSLYSLVLFGYLAW